MEQIWYGLTLVPHEPRNDRITEAILEDRRARGWELVSVHDEQDAEVLVFRRAG